MTKTDVEQLGGRSGMMRRFFSWLPDFIFLVAAIICGIEMRYVLHSLFAYLVQQLCS